MIKKLATYLAVILWPTYSRSSNSFSIKILLKHWVLQKVLRVNGHVPWPVHSTSIIKAPNKISPGTRAPGLSAGCHIDGRNGIIIGKNVWIGPRVSIISMNHDTRDYQKYIESNPVIIKDNCWLATNSVILPGVTLGEHTIVSAGAVVTKTFEEGDIILGGVPARIIKKVDIYDEVA